MVLPSIHIPRSNKKQDVMQIPDDAQRPNGPLNRTWSEWLSTLPVFLLLILTLVIGTGEMIHGQLLRLANGCSVILQLAFNIHSCVQIRPNRTVIVGMSLTQ
jgi:hypothetical protein